VLPNANLPTGEEIKNGATIVFDQNEAIQTAPWLNTIDASTPTSRIAAIAPAAAGGVCGDLAVSWGGSDTGAGIDHYDLYVSQNDAPFAIWKPMTSATSAIYPGVVGSSYRFASVATDGVLHSESAPGTPSSPVTAACAAAGSSPPAAAAHISHLSFSPAAFAVGKAATALSAARKTHAKAQHGHVALGSTIGYLLSAPSQVSIAIERPLAGLRLARRGCVVATAAARKAFLAAAAHTLKHKLSAAARRRQLSALLRHARCTALQTLATLTRSGHTGTNQIPFSGRLGTRALAVGAYEARASVVPVASPASTADASFRILAGAAKRRSHKG
jgi:hypothetical protein